MRHYHEDLSSGLPLPMLDDGDESEIHCHVHDLGRRYSVVLHHHGGYEASRALVPEVRLVEHLAWAAEHVDLPA